MISLIIMLTMGRPVLYRHERPGLQDNIFVLYKFRSMKNVYDGDGNLLPESHRLTTFGSFLRKTSLDELPELINVLRGDMSLVGPRPLIIDYLPLYNDVQKQRHNVRPGITGWAQINGRNAISWEEKFDLDVWYVNNQSFALDLKIILLTLGKVIKREGIYSSEEIVMHPFTGSGDVGRGQ